jgi:SNF2 family DNA or RNA helicase
LTSVLPTAGHAALATDAVTIWSAESAVTAFRNAVAVNHEGVAAGVEAVLRPYQRAGAAWLRAARGHGGAVLADEMGLGKTVQAIAVLAAHTDRAHPIVCPTTLVGNWVRELAKFAPEVRTLSYFGTDRQTLLNTAAPGTVVITSYGVLRSDADALSRHDWDVVVLDEAQQIKNPDALAARAARDLPARLRVAMTGTPVENRLDELWSLLAFTNPGVLGTRARFRRRFAGSIERGGSAAAAVRLHEIIAPHILRRLKRDVAPELPDKIDATVVCPLSDEQHRLYRASVEGAFAAGLGSGQSRRGRILALLTRLKQICNHPELVTPTGQPLAGRSGKLDRATEILAEVVDAGDRALVFTQFRETGELLGRHLAENVTGSPVPFLHGGLTASRREELVDQFQNDATSSPILVLSLRAAGFGLNLTEATHVMHYDRWWNPAVEDQASDRAHRHRTDPHRHSPYPGHRTLHRRSHRRAARRETGPRGSGTGRDHQPGHRPGHTQ